MQNGFSLLETLFAVAIFSLGALGILLALGKDKAGASNLDNRLQAAMLVNQAAALAATHQDTGPLSEQAAQLLPQGTLAFSEDDPPQVTLSWRNHTTGRLETLTYGATP